MSSFDQSPPRLTENALKDLLSNQYGLHGDVSMLDGERDLNALISGTDGKFVLKVIHPAEELQFIELQNAVLEHLVECGFDEIPSVMPTKSGHRLGEVTHDGGTSVVRAVRFLDGMIFSNAPKTQALYRNFGAFLGRLSLSLQGFGHPAAHRPDFLWNLDNAEAVAGYLTDIEDTDRRAMIARHFDHYRHFVLPKLSKLRASVLHQDANDNNVIVDPARPDQITGLIDFGDMCFGHTVNELAVALAYALLDSENIYATATALIAGYTKVFPLTEGEVDVLFDLARMRLCTSVCISSRQSKKHSDNEYLLISQAPAFALLERLDTLNRGFMTALARKAAGFSATPNHDDVLTYLTDVARPVPMFQPDLRDRARCILQSDRAGMPAFSDPAFDAWFDDHKQGDADYFGIGLYGEVRSVYATDAFSDAAGPERRTRHMGIDIFIDAGEAIYAPLDGTVLSVTNNDFHLDYGHTLILAHKTPSGRSFYTLYGHLGASLPKLLHPGDAVQSGQLIAHVGDWPENGHWAPHLHFQIMTDMLGLEDNFYGVGHDSLWAIWGEICPDPNLLFGLTPECFIKDPAGPNALMQRRDAHIGPSLSVSYKEKLKIVRGRGAYLFDHTGRRFLDCVNNITHIGHAHPAITAAISQQAAILNTNSRYLSELILDYADRLAAKLPASLSVCYFVNSGTEANELALRIARTANEQKNTVVLDWAYHGNSGGMVEVSPYKFKRKGGFAQPQHVEIAEFPDPYRGRHRGRSENSGIAYAEEVAAAVARTKAKTGNGKTAFIAESISGVGGQVLYPDGYLRAAYAAVRAEGGVTIADEVQCGFGRVGDHFWAFELQDVVPDIVVMGKPIGNGHPLAAVVTTPELAAKFANGMEYFNSFGGNPVSMAVGLAVLDVIENEHLQANATETGGYLKAGLETLMGAYPVIGDVRGTGLFLGAELVLDRNDLTPATELASAISNHMRHAGVLISTDGPLDNVLKIKPPMVFGRVEADRLLGALDDALNKLS